MRLKSGDPFVASRGAEEAVALTNAGIDVDVVPGVSAALAAPAAAGIPLMLRQLSVTATFVDGNDDDEHAEPPDWAALARLGGTLVILTGRGRIKRTAAALIAGGRDPGTPVAAISAAARDTQQVLRGTLAAASRSFAPAGDLRRRPRRRTRPMHIPDGFLTGEAAPLGTATAVAGLAVCLRGARRSMREKDLPLAGLAAAFFLVAEAPMVPITVGTQGHLLGGALAVVLLGPWAGALTIAVVCAIQALVLGDGGITTLGLTITNLALVPAFVGYPLLLALRRPLGRSRSPRGDRRGQRAARGDDLPRRGRARRRGGDRPHRDRGLDPRLLRGDRGDRSRLTFLIVRALLAVRPDLVRAARRSGCIA